MRTLFYAVLICSTLPLAVRAQAPFPGIEPGARIRITSSSIDKADRIGRLDSISANMVHFRPASQNTSRSIAADNVNLLEVSRGLRTRRPEFALLGALSGGLLGYVSSNHNGQGLGTGKTEAGQNAFVGGIVGAAVGAGLGWWFGGKTKTDNWRPVTR